MPKRKQRQDTPIQIHLIKIIFGLALLIFLVVLAGVLAHRYISHPKPTLTEEKIRPLKERPAKPGVVTPKVRKKPPFEIFPKEEEPTPVLPPEPKVPLKKLPKVAIIIDDLGNDEKIAEKFMSLDAPLTFSIVPLSPHTKRIAIKAHAKGFEVMLHLPMEPNEYPRVNPGPGTLLTSMTPDELINQLKKNIDDVPNIKGVNNHMGSKMTAVDAQMNQIFTILKKQGLFFIDSRTTTETLGRQSARLLRVPFAERDIFLDHIQTSEFIRRQIKQLIKIAYHQGQAIGIGHPHPITYKVLQEVLKELKAKVRLVHASEVVNLAG